MKRVIATGRTVEEAVTSALVKLGVARSQAQIRVLSEPVKGLFGFIGGKDAEVEVVVLQSPAEVAKDFIETALKHMGVYAHATVERDSEAHTEHCLRITCDDADLPVVIGRHGSTLDALQYLTNIAANKDNENFAKFSLDAGEYRRRRRESLKRIADNAAERAVKTGRPVSLDAMSVADRKWVHTYLQGRTDITTMSEGQDPYRKVKVAPKRHHFRNAVDNRR